MQIQQRLFILILGITVPILLGSGIFSYMVAEDEITSDILMELDTIASIEKLRILDFIERNFERLDGISSRTQLRLSISNYLESPNIADQEKINKIIDDAKFGISDIDEIHYLNFNGKVLFSTEDDYVGKDFLQSDSFKMAHNVQTIQVVFDNPKQPVLHISGPLILDNEFLGVIMIETNSNLLLKNTSGSFTFGNSGEIILSVKNENGDARIITPLLFANYSELIIPKENIQDPIIQSLLKNQSIFTDTIDYHGKPVLSATRYIEETGWGLAVIFDKEESLLPLIKIQFTILFSVILVIAFAILASLYISNSISKPIKKLQQATKEIAQGNLTEKFDISGNDEFTDLTVNIKSLQKNLAQAQNQLVKDERLSAIGELSSRLSHDIRSPLSVIKMVVNLLRKTSKGLDENQIKKLDQIDKSSSKIQHLVENILDFVRTREPQYESTSILEIIDSSKQFIYLPKNIKLNLPSKDLQIICDPNQIEIVIENLVNNSIQAIGETEGTITIKTIDDNEFVVILIQDSGPGIPEEIISKIYDPLFTTKIEGTGLGLASCKSIVDSHKGTLSVSNNPTTFKIKLPKTQTS